MIQVLGLRDYNSHGTVKKRTTFFVNGWRFRTVQEVFNDDLRLAIIEKIPEKERFNLYFTVSDCFEEEGRKIKEQYAIPFDIDNLAFTEGQEHAIAEAAARVACTAIGVDYSKCSVTFSGNGVQFFVHTTTPINSEDYFETTRRAYKALTDRAQLALVQAGISGLMDTSVWSAARLMRLPDTMNVKPGKPSRKAVVLNRGGEAVEFDISLAAGILPEEASQSVPDVVLKNYPKPDTKAICEGCKFLTHCKTKPTEVDEPAWYAMLSITSRLDDGENLSHSYSEGHKAYNHYETELKVKQALQASGPRTCKDIETRWSGCHECEYYGKVASPILIKGPDYIASQDFGFRERVLKVSDSGSKIVPGKPAYGDLIKQFAIEHPYKTVVDNNQVIIFNGKHWLYLFDVEIRGWVQTKINPDPSMQEMREFTDRLKCLNLTRVEELTHSKKGFMNFQNCVLNVGTGETHAHSTEYGFFTTLPYNYDPRAVAPAWDKFMGEIMLDNQEMVDCLNEFAGYSISGDECWLQQALLCIGEGANGKSVFLEILGEVVGRDARSTVPMKEIERDTRRFQLVNKLFNYSEETSVNSFVDSYTFKTLVNGGEMGVKQLYAQPFDVVNNAKLIMACNEMPKTPDNTHGFFRRLAIVKFDALFEKGAETTDLFIKDKLRMELPGICNKLIESYKALKQRRYLSGSKTLDANVEEVKMSSDTILMFMHTCVEMVDDEEIYIKCNELYEEYDRMCDMYNINALPSPTFFKQYAKRTKKQNVMISKNGEKFRAYRGIKINKGY